MVRMPCSWRRLLRYGDSQSCAFGGIGSGAELIEEHQVVLFQCSFISAASSFSDAAGIFPASGESSFPVEAAFCFFFPAGCMTPTERRMRTMLVMWEEKVLKDCSMLLLIADIGENVVEDGKLAAVLRGNVKACLPHQSQQSAGLQGNGLAAGIGTGDDQKIECVAKSNIHRDNGALVEQRMSRSAEQNFPFGVESGSNGVHVLCQHSLGEDEVQLRQNGEIPGDGFRLLRHQGGEMGQNLLDFFFLLKLPPRS